jgi:predicted NUDIX family NTP pyrophosphohydrolase
VKKTAGILVFRRRERCVEIFLVHPGGPYWKSKDTHAWSIPKGEFVDEPAEAAARREFHEETGQVAPGSLAALPLIRGSGKEIHAFVVESEAPDPAAVRSNTFELEWPPKSGRTQRFPEVDQAAWFPLAQARAKIHKGQQALLDELVVWLKGSARSD